MFSPSSVTTAAESPLSAAAATTDSPIQQSNAAAELLNEIEKKVSYRKGVENMLSLVQNENARAELQKQLASVIRDIEALQASMDAISVIDVCFRYIFV